jgi:hypothetical protein
MAEFNLARLINKIENLKRKRETEREGERGILVCPNPISFHETNLRFLHQVHGWWYMVGAKTYVIKIL